MHEVVITIRDKKFWLWRSIDADHRAHKGLNNRIENTRRQTRKREKIMGRFKSSAKHSASCQPTIR